MTKGFWEDKFPWYVEAVFQFVPGVELKGIRDDFYIYHDTRVVKGHAACRLHSVDGKDLAHPKHGEEVHINVLYSLAGHNEKSKCNVSFSDYSGRDNKASIQIVIRDYNRDLLKYMPDGDDIFFKDIKIGCDIDTSEKFGMVSSYSIRYEHQFKARSWLQRLLHP